MTDDEINLAIVEALGWQRTETSYGPVWWMSHKRGFWGLGGLPWARSADAALRDLHGPMFEKGLVLSVAQHDDGTFQVNWRRGADGEALIRGEVPRAEPFSRALCLSWLAQLRRDP